MLGRGTSPWPPVGALTLALLAWGCASEQPAPLQAGCAEGQILLADGSCVPVGVPAIACAEGFVAEGAGCAPLLPAEPCGDGLMALPGDAECHELLPCGSGPWGELATEADTEHVDPTYDGSDSDGSAERPWPTIAQALAAAAPGVIVALAAGSYAEHVLLAEKPVRLWGRCPRLVAIAAPVGTYATIDVELGADGAELRGLAVSGPSLGIAASGSLGLAMADLWIHDTGGMGLSFDDGLGPTSATVRNVLVERAARSGFYVGGSTVEVEDLVVRDGQPDEAGLYGRGINVEPLDLGYPGATTAFRRGLVERNHEVGILASLSQITLEGMLVRDTAPREADGSLGRGIGVQGGSATIRGCVVERSREFGIDTLAGAEVLIESTVVRDTRSEASSTRRGGAVGAYRANVTMRGCLLERSQAFGIGVLDASLRLERTLLRDIRPGDDGLLGDGVVVVASEQPASAAVWASAIQSSARAGIASFGAPVGLDHAWLECNQIQLDGEQHAGRAPAFDDQGGNVCRCGAVEGTCQVVSAQLQPPSLTGSN